MSIPRWKRPEWREKYNIWRRKVYKQRREEYFADKVCIKCGSGTFLEIHHVEKHKKISHKIWMWSKDRREKELKKCVVLCDTHHNRHHAEEKKNAKSQGILKKAGDKHRSPFRKAQHQLRKNRKQQTGMARSSRAQC